jgi:hypothetical protein
LREAALAAKGSAPSAQPAKTATTCGRPSGRTVASQYGSASVRRARAPPPTVWAWHPR